MISQATETASKKRQGSTMQSLYANSCST